MEYAEERKPGEDVVEDRGVQVFIDPKAVLSCSTTRTRPRPAAAASRWPSRPCRRNGCRPPPEAGGRPQAAWDGVVIEASSTTRLRPPRLAANMHRSARSSSEAGVSPARCSATPRDTVTLPSDSPVERLTSSRPIMLERIVSAIRTASSRLAPGRMIPNSSPPNRARRAFDCTLSRITTATRRRT
ncbi:hypothetical protein Lal_00014660 [Lupinus albus]|nr:hypothetical protein Lal_00014660 [Lupinus albus]